MQETWGVKARKAHTSVVWLLKIFTALLELF